MKQCTKCKTTKPFGEFGVDARRKDGHVPWCKTCRANYQRKYRASDPKVREYLLAYHLAQYRSNANYHASCQMRRIVHRVLRIIGTKKTTSSQNLLGYSAKELRAHLENQFLPGMSWETHGAWHIDHIKPISAFIAEGITDPKIINALSNLRPLWARDNLVKGAK